MIELSRVSLHYADETALKDVDLSIGDGELVCIVGASGSGKTSIISLVSGLKKASVGSVKVAGEPVDEPRQSTALILQNYGLLPWKTVYDNIAFTLKIRRVEGYQESVEAVLDQMGLRAYRDRYPHQLSGGQRQRVAIGRALALKADLILMDEAFSALDSITKEGLQAHVLELNQKDHKTILFVTHNIEEAVFLGSRILVMSKGCLVHDLSNQAQGQREGRDYYAMCSQLRKCLHD